LRAAFYILDHNPSGTADERGTGILPVKNGRFPLKCRKKDHGQDARATLFCGSLRPCPVNSSLDTDCVDFTYLSGGGSERERETMIQDWLHNAERHYEEHPGFRAAFEFLRAQNLHGLPLGRREIDGARLYAVIARDRGRVGAKLEAHRKYIDIQYVIAGEEVIGGRPIADCKKSMAPFDARRDIGFFADRPDMWLSVPQGMFVILFPGDAHVPLAGEDEVHKVVVKVAVQW
jgi:YhcH/YjgK/YiaL family protein